jgi:hypothetical protein
MKVGVVTFHFAVNYGAVLQACATCKMLEDLGHEPVIIDYRPQGSLYDHYHQWDFRRLGLNAQNILKLRLNPKFRDFTDKLLPIGRDVICTPEQLAHYSQNFDAILYGSDQVWNPSIFGGKLDRAYWAEGVSASVRRIALSASFGGDLNSIRQHANEINQLAQNFDAISVREKDALQIFDSVLASQIIQLADPVFGMKSWDDLLEPIKNLSDFAFEFAIQPRASFRKTSLEISGSLGLESICADARLNLKQSEPKSKVMTVGQWLWSLKHAEIVMTNSFHATVFCILFNTPFVFIPLEGKAGQPNPRNNRILDLLEWTGLDSRIYDPVKWDGDILGLSQMCAQDFDVANRAVVEKRKELLAYLKAQLV